MTLPPTSDEQLQFLQNLQRLFEEGDFAATYKYALLLALSELAVELGDDTGTPLDLPLGRIAEKFAELYWPQTIPYSVEGADVVGAILAQNRGQQAAVVRHLMRIRNAGAISLPDAMRHSRWPSTVREIERIVREMPIRFLQNISGSVHIFLYDPVLRGRSLKLLPSVAFNLRKFQGFVQQLARMGWVNHLRKNGQNAALVGQVADLEEFMFGTPRSALSEVGRVLRSIQNNRCFYCAETLRSTTAVDHFVPWSRYPRDTALNFVLTHAKCNAAKRDILAARRHLDHWLNRNLSDGDDILQSLEHLGFVMDRRVTSMIAHWAYQQAANQGSHGWLHGHTTELITQEYLLAFG